MSDTTNVIVKAQRVFHDGTSMIVLKPSDKAVPIPAHLVDTFVAEGAVAKVKAKDEPKGKAKADDDAAPAE